ncbi:MAG: LPS assembly protein LptD [Desulfuromonas sp.]|nr:LPS assembly protein LptD [Desulfuromonas sp.]
MRDNRYLTLKMLSALVGVISCLITASVAVASDVQKRDAPVEIQADELNFDKQTGIYAARGQVDIQQDQTRLQADKVDYNTITGDADAVGNAVLNDPDGTLAGSELNVNMKTNIGVANNAKGFLAAYNFHIAGDEISKLGEYTYQVKNGSFTTCDAEPPAWKFSASKLDVTLGGMARARNVKFYLHDIPVLYLPYIAYPVNTERQSGFLLPMFGYSSDRGTQLSLAYYQVIARNMDATLYTDYFSDMGLGVGMQYRYILGDDNAGEANLYYLSSNGNSDYADLDDSFAWRWDHLGTLPYGVRFSADSEYVSDNTYFEEFGEIAEEYNKDEVESTIALSKSWGNLAATLSAIYTKDLDETADNDDTLQRLPEFQLDYMRTRIGQTPLYFKFDSTSTYFWRREGTKGERVEARPAMSAFFLPGNVLEIEPEVGYRQRFYWTSGDGSEYEHAENYDFSTRFATRVSRIFDLGKSSGLTKIKHSVEPEVTYLYTPNKNQDDLPYFDSADIVDNENEIEYAVVNRFIGRFIEDSSRPSYRELVYLRLSQTYDIWMSRRGRADKLDSHSFSDIRTELIVRPTSKWTVDIDFKYDPHRSKFSKFSAETGARYSDDLGFNAAYRYVEDTSDDDTEDGSEYISAGIDLDWIKPLYVKYEYRYDCVDQARLENLVSLEYRSQCWSVFLSYRDRVDDNEIMLTFALGGIGAIGHVGSSLSAE